MGQKPYAKERDEVLQSSPSRSGHYVEHGAVAGAHRPQTSDLSSKKCPLTTFQHTNNASLSMSLQYRPDIR
jgi:hypothetical protein